MNRNLLTFKPATGSREPKTRKRKRATVSSLAQVRRDRQSSQPPMSEDEARKWLAAQVLKSATPHSTVKQLVMLLTPSAEPPPREGGELAQEIVKMIYRRSAEQLSLVWRLMKSQGEATG